MSRAWCPPCESGQPGQRLFPPRRYSRRGSVRASEAAHLPCRQLLGQSLDRVAGTNKVAQLQPTVKISFGRVGTGLINDYTNGRGRGSLHVVPSSQGGHERGGRG